MSLLLLVRRHLRTAAGPTVALAVIAMLAATVTSAVPRAVAALHAEQLAHATAQASAIARDVIATSPGVPGYGAGYVADDGPVLGATGAGSVDPPQPDLDGYRDGLRALAAAQPEPLARVLGEPDLLVSGERVDVRPVEGNDVAAPRIVLRAGATARDQVELVEGRWPEPTPVVADRDAMLPGTDGVVDAEPVPLEVAMSTASAAELGWTLGSVHPTDDPLLPPAELVGTWEPRDASADYWVHGPLAVTPEVVLDPNVGKIATAAVFADPGTLGAWVTGPTTRIWFPVDTSAVTSADAPALLAQLRGLTATTSTPVEGDAVTLEPTSGLVDVLERVLGQRQGVDAVVAVLAVGPLGALVAVLVLAAGLVLDRRRSALALVRARGASGVWARGVVAVEGLVVGLPAAVAGTALGLVVVPGPVSPAQLVAALGCGLAPAVALGAVATSRGTRARRADLDVVPARRRRHRLLVEAAVALAAGLTAVLALDRGVVAGADGTGPAVDPLVVAAPLLVSVTAALVVLRLVPPVVRGVERVLARRADLVPFLGAARVRRDAAGGLLPALALVLAVGVAASSTVLAATVRDGVTREAWGAVGADVRVAGPLMDDETVSTLAGVAGVAAVASVVDLGRVQVEDAGGTTTVTVYATDAEALAAVQADVPGAPERSAALVAPDGGTLPVVAAGDLADGPLRWPGGQEVAVLERVDRLPGFPPATAALLVDATTAAARLDVGAGSSRLALLGLDDGATAADRARVEREVAAVEPNAVVDDPVAGERALLSSPSAAGLRTAFVLAVVLSALLAAATVVLALVLAAPARRRLLAVLRTLGLPAGAERGIVAWETAPWTAAGLLAGGALGWAVPALVLAVVDLTPLTGGDTAPPLVADPLWLGALALGLVGVVAIGAAVAGRLGRRRDVDQLRAGTD
ncbi:putative ABC transport system permease protein [Isoptericola sp. CG 20/1183]|uniref:ABC transport system permease protein n=1 Tax=Isoptericola halotolerans TaxID=300560 RepID=A0ABX5EF42_9MICO|nr:MULTISPECIES: FtsX-like permease family protein [Isoptericola]PRZ07767.1 putative ABC transport system permease protein [Isoptericola halotolerans]PRZ07874.1 putative ABC transport system permease protein [Isoptericola sp. CG 20/1183]